MDFTLSDEQVLLRDSVAGFLRQHYPFDRRVAITRSDAGNSAELWQELASRLGLLSLALPGAGGPVSVMVAMEQAGEALLAEPLLENVVIAGGLLRAVGDEAAVRSIASGERRWAFAWAEPGGRYRFGDVATRARPVEDGWLLSGAKAVVVAAPWSSDLIVTARTADGEAGVSLFAVPADAPGVRLSPYPTIDGRRAADIAFDDVRLPGTALLGSEGAALPIVEAMADAAIAATCAEAVGIMRRLHRDTVAYLRQRQQFGKPLFDFQAVQHRLVDMLTKIELATSATYLATLRLDAEPAVRARAASAAKAVVDDAGRFVGENAVQLHGGMGMTDELPIGHYFKRLLAIAADFGSRDHHLARYAALSGAG